MLQRVRDTPPPPRVIRPPPPPSTDIQKTFGLSRPYLSPGNNSPLSCDWIPGLKPLVSVVPIYLTPWNDIDLLVSTEHLALSRFRVPSSSSLPPSFPRLVAFSPVALSWKRQNTTAQDPPEDSGRGSRAAGEFGCGTIQQLLYPTNPTISCIQQLGGKRTSAV